MAGRHQLEEAGHILDRHGLHAVAAGRHHHVRRALDYQIDAGGAEARGQQAVVVRGRAAALFKTPPKWRRPKAEDVAKALDLGFLYTYGYLHASAQVHPMADDGLQDFHLLTGAEPAPEFPDQSAVLGNTLLVNTMLLQDAMNASSMRWMALVFNALNDIREFLVSGQHDTIERLATLAAAFQQNMVLSESRSTQGA